MRRPKVCWGTDTEVDEAFFDAHKDYMDDLANCYGDSSYANCYQGLGVPGARAARGHQKGIPRQRGITPF